MGISADDLFDKSGKNQNSLHYKYNKFLVSPYLPRGYNYSFNNQPKNDESNDNKENDLENSIGEIQMYYPKPNNYNSIYTQKFSKKYKNFYNQYPNYIPNPTDNYNFNNRNTPIRLIEKEYDNNTVKTPNYQIKKEIQFQRTPDKYKEYENNSNEIDGQNNNRYNNYKRYYDYYYPNNKIERFNSPVISKIAENNFICQDFNNRHQYSTPGLEDKRRRLYLSQNYP